MPFEYNCVPSPPRGMETSNLYLIQFICILESQVVARVLDGKLLYTKILEVHLFAFAYRLFPRWLERNLYETVCMQMQTN